MAKSYNIEKAVPVTGMTDSEKKSLENSILDAIIGGKTTETEATVNAKVKVNVDTIIDVNGVKLDVSQKFNEIKKTIEDEQKKAQDTINKKRGNVKAKYASIEVTQDMDSKIKGISNRAKKNGLPASDVDAFSKQIEAREKALSRLSQLQSEYSEMQSEDYSIDKTNRILDNFNEQYALKKKINSIDSMKKYSPYISKNDLSGITDKKVQESYEDIIKARGNLLSEANNFYKKDIDELNKATNEYAQKVRDTGNFGEEFKATDYTAKYQEMESAASKAFDSSATKADGTKKSVRNLDSVVNRTVSDLLKLADKAYEYDDLYDELGDDDVNKIATLSGRLNGLTNGDLASLNVSKDDLAMLQEITDWADTNLSDGRFSALYDRASEKAVTLKENIEAAKAAMEAGSLVNSGSTSDESESITAETAAIQEKTAAVEDLTEAERAETAEEDQGDDEVAVTDSETDAIERKADAVRAVTKEQKELNQVRTEGGSNEGSSSELWKTEEGRIQILVTALEKYKLAVAEIDKMKLEPDTDENKEKLEELNELLLNYKKEIMVGSGLNINDSSFTINHLTGESIVNKYVNDDLISREDEKLIREIASSVNNRTFINFDDIDYSSLTAIQDVIQSIDEIVSCIPTKLNSGLKDSQKYVDKLKSALIDIGDANGELASLPSNHRDYADYVEEKADALKTAPELEQFADTIQTLDDAIQLIHKTEWLDFLATLPQAQEYLKNIGYEFKEVSSAADTTAESMSRVQQNTESSAEAAHEEINEQLSEEITSYQKIVNWMNEWLEKQKEIKELGASSSIVQSLNGDRSSMISRSDLDEKNGALFLPKKSVSDMLEAYLEAEAKGSHATGRYKEYLAAYVNELNDTEAAEQIFSEKHAELFAEIQETIANAFSTRTLEQQSQTLENYIIGTLNNSGVEQITLGQWDKIFSSLKDGGIESAFAVIEQELGYKIPAATDQATSANDKLQGELQETAEAAKQANTAMSESAGNTGNATSGIGEAMTAEGKTVTEVVNQELRDLANLGEMVEVVTEAVNEKTEAFRKEGEVVSGVTSDEAGCFDKLNQSQNESTARASSATSGQSSTFKKRASNKSRTWDELSKDSEIYENIIYATEQFAASEEAVEQASETIKRQIDERNKAYEERYLAAEEERKQVEESMRKSEELLSSYDPNVMTGKYAVAISAAKNIVSLLNEELLASFDSERVQKYDDAIETLKEHLDSLYSEAQKDIEQHLMDRDTEQAYYETTTKASENERANQAKNYAESVAARNREYEQIYLAAEKDRKEVDAAIKKSEDILASYDKKAMPKEFAEYLSDAKEKVAAYNEEFIKTFDPDRFEKYNNALDILKERLASLYTLSSYNESARINGFTGDLSEQKGKADDYFQELLGSGDVEKYRNELLKIKDLLDKIQAEAKETTWQQFVDLRDRQIGRDAVVDQIRESNKTLSSYGNSARLNGFSQELEKARDEAYKLNNELLETWDLEKYKTAFSTIIDGINKIQVEAKKATDQQVKYVFNREHGRDETRKSLIAEGEDQAQKIAEAEAERNRQFEQMWLNAEEIQKTDNLISSFEDNRIGFDFADAFSQAKDKIAELNEELEKTGDIKKYRAEIKAVIDTLNDSSALKTDAFTGYIISPKSNFSEIKAEMLKAASAIDGVSERETFFNENTKTLTYTATEASGAIKKYTLSFDDKTGVITRTATEIGRVKSSLETFSNFMATGAKKVLSYVASFGSFYTVLNKLRTAFTAVRELDTELIDLQKTAKMTSSQFEQFYYDSNDVAKSMGVTTKEIISQASAWSRFNNIDPLCSNAY